MQTNGFNPEGFLETIARLAPVAGLRLAAAVGILVAGWIIARLIKTSVRKALEHSRTEPTLIPFVASLAYYLVVTFVVIAGLGTLGIPTAQFVAVIGAAGLAVGLALQGTLSNFASGVLILLLRPFRAGDAVEVGGVVGLVAEVGIFNTTLNTPDNVRVVVPNSSILGQLIKNYSANPTRRIDMVVGISYGDDIGTAIRTIQSVIGADERVLHDPVSQIAVSEMADSSINLVVRPWCKKEDYWNLRFDLTRRIKEQLEAAGCSIPFPQRDVHLFQHEKPAA